MTDDQIERRVERNQDALDKRYLSTGMSQSEYGLECQAITRWAERQYASPWYGYEESGR